MDFNGTTPGSEGPVFVGPIVIDGDLSVNGVVKLENGTDATPSLTYIDEETTGFTRSGPGEVSYVTSGSKRVRLTPNGIIASSGDLSHPSLQLSDTKATGFWLDPTSTLSTVVDGGQTGYFYTDETLFTTNYFSCRRLLAESGLFDQTVEAKDGVISGGTISCGTNSMTCGALFCSSITSSLPLSSSVFEAGDGTNSAPSYTFSSDTQLGLYKSDTKKLSFVSDGTSTMDIEQTKVTVPVIATTSQPFNWRQQITPLTINQGVPLLMDWETTVKPVVGSDITWNGTDKRFELSAAGKYNITGFLYFDASSISGFRAASTQVKLGSASYAIFGGATAATVTDKVTRVPITCEIIVDPDELPSYIQIYASLESGVELEESTVNGKCNVTKVS